MISHQANMLTVEEIQAAIESLSEEEYVRLRAWFSERDWDEWDEEIAKDSEAGRLDFLIDEALEGKTKGTRSV
jgi:hypothetical protein